MAPKASRLAKGEVRGFSCDLMDPFSITLRESKMRRSELHITQLLFAALACFSFHQHATAADPGRSIIPHLRLAQPESLLQLRRDSG